MSTLAVDSRWDSAQRGVVSPGHAPRGAGCTVTAGEQCASPGTGHYSSPSVTFRDPCAGFRLVHRSDGRVNVGSGVLRRRGSPHPGRSWPRFRALWARLALGGDRSDGTGAICTPLRHHKTHLPRPRPQALLLLSPAHGRLYLSPASP
ncbi:hypothetical protein COCON_G00087320 [Conger conger]|uniref:Uncharacterized protein n=1 Tax=Conger conger TaxID=82655 RepID=A0A9Q1DKA2_CONCO|nr:hypothetical protein COCON_G00087320 [Conger conger]